MPVLAVVTHLALVDADGFSAIVAVLGEHVVEAAETVRLALPHDIALTAQLLIAIEACKVLHVPRSTLSFRTLVGQDYLNDNGKMEKIC